MIIFTVYTFTNNKNDTLYAKISKFLVDRHQNLSSISHSSSGIVYF